MSVESIKLCFSPVIPVDKHIYRPLVVQYWWRTHPSPTIANFKCSKSTSSKYFRHLRLFLITLMFLLRLVGSVGVGGLV